MDPRTGKTVADSIASRKGCSPGNSRASRAVAVVDYPRNKNNCRCALEKELCKPVHHENCRKFRVTQVRFLTLGKIINQIRSFQMAFVPFCCYLVQWIGPFDMFQHAGILSRVFNDLGRLMISITTSYELLRSRVSFQLIEPGECDCTKGLMDTSDNNVSKGDLQGLFEDASNISYFDDPLALLQQLNQNMIGFQAVGGQNMNNGHNIPLQLGSGIISDFINSVRNTFTYILQILPNVRDSESGYLCFLVNAHTMMEHADLKYDIEIMQRGMEDIKIFIDHVVNGYRTLGRMFTACIVHPESYIFRVALTILRQNNLRQGVRVLNEINPNVPAHLDSSRMVDFLPEDQFLDADVQNEQRNEDADEDKENIPPLTQ